MCNDRIDFVIEYIYISLYQRFWNRFLKVEDSPKSSVSSQDLNLESGLSI